MRLVTVKAPQGVGNKIAEIAFQCGISEVSIHEETILEKNNISRKKTVLELATNTNNAKLFIERLMDSPFYNTKSFSLTTRHPESIFGNEPIEIETFPINRPTTDVYEELWQFTLITKSLVGRVLISALLLAYGMHSGYMPLIIASLLFLPFHHHLLSMSLGAGIREWKFFRQGFYTFLLSTFLIMVGGLIVALITKPEIKWTAFAETPLLFSFFISMLIGVTAGLASSDDAGRRELIGLAATAHVSIYPVWFGLKFIYGFNQDDKPFEFLLVFLMDVVTIVAFSALTFKIMKMRGKGIRNFVSNKEMSS